MDKPLKKRLIGAIILLAIGVIAIPILLDGPTRMDDQSLTYLPDSPALPQQDDLVVLPNLEDFTVEAMDGAFADNVQEIMAESDIDERLEALIANEAWTIQVGAFSEANNAERLQAQLQEQGYATYVRNNAEGLAQVFVGPELNQNYAEARLDELKETLDLEGILMPFVPALTASDSEQQG